MAVVASAPGKVLMTGGYLILQRPNAGIVLSTNARFYAIVKPLYEEIRPDSWAWSMAGEVMDPLSIQKPLSDKANKWTGLSDSIYREEEQQFSNAWTDVKLTSPQMGRETMYKLSVKHLQLQPVSSSDSRNPFVEYALQYAVAAAHAIIGKTNGEKLQKLLLLGLDITILGCNEFYSYRNQIEACGLPLTPESLASLPPFSSITFNAEESSGQESKPEVAKTGLGSSAAMTTAVVAALLHYLGAVNLPSELNGPHQGSKVSEELDVVHIIAQTAHCIAQGKVGSGFDVSSAVYGSHRYIRFSPEVLSSVQFWLKMIAEIVSRQLINIESQSAVQGMSLEEVIGNVLKANWDHERTKFSLPPMMTLLLGEPGTGGSSTPSMVGAVKKWQKSDPQNSLETWKKLSEANSALEMHLNTLSKLAEINYDDYTNVINKCSTLTSEKWMEEGTEPKQMEVVKELLGARDAMLVIRCNMRKMGEAAGIPVEPESQTKLLDTTMSTEGVLLAGVPGAGGFDAVFAIALGDSSSNVVKVWSSLNVLALLVREDPRGVYSESNDPRVKEVTGAVSSIHIK